MAARSSCGAIISFVSRLVNDPSNETFSIDDVQDMLDVYRWEARYQPLDTLPTRAAGGVTKYVTFVSGDSWQYWETDTKIYDASYTEITPLTSDWTIGRWVMASEPARPVTALGFSHDPYAAAAKLLEQRGAQLAEDIQSFSGQNGSFSYANKRRGPLEMAARYWNRARAAVVSHEVIRTDTNVLD